MASPILELTDGTDTISLIQSNGHKGFHLDEDGWNPTIPDYKGGGVWQDSPLAGGRRIVDRRFGDAVESFRLKANSGEQDNLITFLQDLRRMAEKATNYWTTSWQSQAVWLKAQASCETNPRYAVIKRARLTPDDNPYEQPFFGPKPVMDELTLVIERGEWTENQPETGTAIQTYNAMTYDGRSHGRAATTTDEVFVANKLCEANLSDVYVDDGGAFGGNLLDAALPYNLLPAVPVANDAVYFGIDSSLADSGSFSSIVFDIGTAQTGVTGTVWEYYNGAWATLTVQDNTNAQGAGTGDAFDTTGVNSAHWSPPTDWTTVAVNGVTGYWVRMRVTAAAGATAPTQQNRDPYAAMLPYVDIAAAQVTGDIPPLARILAHGRGADTNRFIYGIRSLSRGSNFAAYINISDVQVPTGITITDEGSAIPDYIADLNAPTGRALQLTIPAGETRYVRLSFSSTVAHEYYGTYHLYIRCQQTSGTGQARATIAQGSSAATMIVLDQTDWVSKTSTDAFQVFDMGRVKMLVDTLSVNDGFYTDRLNLRMAFTGMETLNLYDVILIPVDEYSIDVTGEVGGEVIDWRRYLDVDAITYLKAKQRGLVRYYFGGDYVQSIYRTVSSSPAIFQPNAAQRVWFLSSEQVSSTREDFNPAMSYSIQAQRQARYLSMRGNR